MGDSLAIVTGVKVSVAMFHAMVLTWGGYFDPFGLANMSREDPEAYICLSVYESGIEVFIEEHVDWVEKFVAHMGTRPQTYIEIDIDSRPGSKELAIDFALQCSDTWPCALCTLVSPCPFLTKEDLQKVKRDGTYISL